MKSLIDEIVDSLFIITILVAWLYIVYIFIKYKINPIDQLELGLKSFERKLKNIEIVRLSRMDELNKKILQWAKDRELDKKGTVKAQAIKTVEELSELVKAVCKDDREEIIDAIGDVYVTLVIGNMLDEQVDLEKIYYYADDDGNTRIDFDKEDIINNLATSICHIVEIKRVTYSEIQLYEILQNLILTAYNYDLDFTDCVESAYNVIKNRKGKIVDGQYIKEE